MTSRIRNITVDSISAPSVAGFWQEVTGYHLDSEPGEPEAALLAPDGSATLLFIDVPETKTVKNRVHVDIQPTDRSRDEEVERLTALGATQVADHRRPDGTGWVVMTDPEGNEFCVERSAAERGYAGPREGAAPTPSFANVGTLTAQPGRRDEVVALLTRSSDELRRAGCLLYEVGTNDEQPDVVFVAELWTSAEAHRASLQLPSVKAAIAEAMPLLTGDFGGFRFDVAGSPLR